MLYDSQSHLNSAIIYYTSINMFNENNAFSHIFHTTRRYEHEEGLERVIFFSTYIISTWRESPRTYFPKRSWKLAWAKLSTNVLSPLGYKSNTLHAEINYTHPISSYILYLSISNNSKQLKLKWFSYFFYHSIVYFAPVLINRVSGNKTESKT